MGLSILKVLFAFHILLVVYLQLTILKTPDNILKPSVGRSLFLMTNLKEMILCQHI